MCSPPDLLSALPSCLRLLPPVCPQAHRQTITLRPTSPARPPGSTMRPMWFGEEPTVEPSCAVDPTGPSSAIALPITAVWSSADRITDIALPITAVRSSADRITDGRSSAAGLTGLSSADVAGKSRRLLIGRGRGGAELGPLPRRRKEPSLTVGNLSRRRVLNRLRDPRPFAPTWPGGRTTFRPLSGAFSFVPRACGYAWPTLARKDVPGFGTCCTRRMLAISSAPDVPDLYNGCASITAILVADILPPTTAPNWDSKHGDCLSL